MKLFVLDDGETWTLSQPTTVLVTPEQLTRIEGGEKVYSVVPDWDKSKETSRDNVRLALQLAALVTASSTEEHVLDMLRGAFANNDMKILRALEDATRVLSKIQETHFNSLT